uniref:Protein kinase domain-containing protein n=1 Tax=Wuchereria bancrofti TaxID=6293 RepID=A0AAF5PU00_WUCBA
MCNRYSLVDHLAQRSHWAVLFVFRFVTCFKTTIRHFPFATDDFMNDLVAAKMKSKNKKTAEKSKGNEDSASLAGKTETETTEITSRGTVENISFSSEENEQSGIEAELPIGVKTKTFLKDGEMIEIDKKRYIIDGPIKGDYGIVGLMERGNSKALFALHYEIRNCKIKRLQVEINVLKSSKKVRKLTHIFPLISQGKNTKVNIRYFMTKMFGETISDLRDRFGEFSTATSLKLSYLAIECIEEIHKIGFIHRDIKPAVYAIGLESERSQLFLLGFGLARCYKTTDKNASVKKRDKVHRMGNIHYMSRSSHKYLERSRKDDLESWLYMIVEFFLTTSSLPWEDEKNNTTVLKRKEAFMNNDYLKIFKKCKGLPAGVNTILRQINSFQYDTKPDYHLIKNIFRNAIVSGNYKSEKLDWLKGKEDEMIAAGACESKIFNVKSEREKEFSQRSQRSIRQEKKGCDLESKAVDEQRSVFMMPKVNSPKSETLSLQDAKSCYYTPTINANENSYLLEAKTSKSKSVMKNTKSKSRKSPNR